MGLTDPWTRSHEPFLFEKSEPSFESVEWGFGGWVRAQRFLRCAPESTHELVVRERTARCCQQLADFLSGQRQLFEALEAAGSGAPNRVLEIQYTLGEVHEANGNTSAALDAFSRVYEKDIQYRDVAEKIHSLGSANES